MVHRQSQAPQSLPLSHGDLKNLRQSRSQVTIKLTHALVPVTFVFHAMTSSNNVVQYRHQVQPGASGGFLPSAHWPPLPCSGSRVCLCQCPAFGVSLALSQPTVHCGLCWPWGVWPVTDSLCGNVVIKWYTFRALWPSADGIKVLPQSPSEELSAPSRACLELGPIHSLAPPQWEFLV